MLSYYDKLALDLLLDGAKPGDPRWAPGPHTRKGTMMIHSLSPDYLHTLTLAKGLGDGTPGHLAVVS